MNRFLIAAATIVGACPPVFAADLILCQGEANGHLQGFDSDGKFIYWSMFTNLIKTDYAGKVVAERPVDPHHGDCCVHDGKIYVATENRVKEKENGETRLMVARNIKKDNGRWTASAAPAILKNGRLEWESK